MITHDVLVTVSKTPPGEHPYDPRPARESCRAGRLRRDDVLPARRRHRGALPGPRSTRWTRRSTSSRTTWRLRPLRRPAFASARSATTFCTSAAHLPLRAMRFAAWSTTSSRSTEGNEVFPHEVEVAFNSAYDKLLRAFDGLELSRDLIASVRDYLQSKVANDQNEVTKKLTALASMLLVPTFIVGVYGQNFRHHFPELALAVRLRLVVGPDHRDHDCAAGVLQEAWVDLAAATLKRCRTSSAPTASSAQSTTTGSRRSTTCRSRASAAASGFCSS